jgi:hypothetical protein
MLKQLLLLNTAAPEVHVVHFADALKQACNVIFGIPLEDMETEAGKQTLTKVKWPLNQLRPKTPGKHDYEVVGYSPYHPQSGAPKYMTVREVLQFVGTELFRNQLDPDIWLNSVFLKPWAEDDVVIIADARFPNEAILGRQHGLLINVQRDTGMENDGHVSENALADYDGYHYVVQNNGSFDDLKVQLADILDTCHSN